MPAAPKQRKIAIVGSRSVGKSSLTVRFVEHHFVESYYPTIENTFSRIIKYNGQDYATEIVDTAGQDEYSILNSKHFIGIHGYIIVYSVTSRQSFEMVRTIRDKILNHLGADEVPLVIVGNKSDLKPEQRQVSTEEGRQLAEDINCAFTEASAFLDFNVSKAFDLMIGQIEKSQNPSQPTGGNKCALMSLVLLFSFTSLLRTSLMTLWTLIHPQFSSCMFFLFLVVLFGGTLDGILFWNCFIWIALNRGVSFYLAARTGNFNWYI